MKPLTLTLQTASSLALRRFASERGLSLDDAAAEALREWLIGAGYLEEEFELDEETETEGSA